MRNLFRLLWATLPILVINACFPSEGKTPVKTLWTIGQQDGTPSGLALAPDHFRDFIEHVFQIIDSIGVHRPISVGFSDDDAGNVKAVSDYIRSELVKRFKGFKFVVYDTSDASLDNGRKVTVAGQLTLPGF